MFWTKSIWPNAQDIILLAKFMLDKNILDRPILDKIMKMILDGVLHFVENQNCP